MRPTTTATTRIRTASVLPARGRRALGALLPFFLMLTFTALAAATASAAPPPFLAQVPEDKAPGEKAGRMRSPFGAAADPGGAGHLFIADAENNRISEFTAWGEFVRAFGWEVDASDPQPELQTCTKATGCKAGSAGPGAGRLNSPEAIAVDGSGNVYVMEFDNERVQRFDPDGGPGETAVVLKEFGEAGMGPGQFIGGAGVPYLNRLASCRADDSLWVGEKAGRIQRFDPEGVFAEAIETPGGKEVEAIAVDSECDLYVAYSGEAGVTKIEPESPYTPIGEFEPESAGERPRAVAVDGAGDLYVVLAKSGGDPDRVQKYDGEGTCLTCGEDGEGGKEGFDRIADNSQLLGVAASGACDPMGRGENAYTIHYTATSPPRAYLRAYDVPDPAVAGCEPPLRPPVVAAQYASAVGTTTATIRANINPKFWSGTVGTTNYYAQWGTTACIEAEGWEAPCAAETPAAPGAALGGEPTDSPVPTAPISLEGLTPGTSYSYRFIASSEGGGPVIGDETRFRTFKTGPQPACPNDGFRSGAGAALPDCRAYELVSPLDKEGGDIVTLLEATTGLPATLSQSAAGGERIAYGSYRAFDGAESAPRNSQYIATRIAGQGWRTRGISPPAGKAILSASKRFDNEYRAFSEDLCTAWVQSFAEPILAPEAPPGFSDLYRRSDEECGGPTYTPLNTEAPAGATGGGFDIELQGLSDDGLTAAFLADGVLATGGTAGRAQLYGRRGAVERMLCLLPEGGGPVTGSCTAGGRKGNVKDGRNRETQAQGAVSADGERVFFTATPGGPGPIYVRERPFATALECSTTGPCTRDVSKAAEAVEGSTGSAFQAAAADGSRALLITGGALYEYDLQAGEAHEIAGEVVGAILGASEDARRTYFVSREAKAPGATPGQGNLYLHEDGEYRLVAVLGAADLGGALKQSPVAEEPAFHLARVSTSGLHAAFTAATSLAGYDNADAETGEADAEVYLYDAEAEELRCASCNPTGARPHGKVPSEGSVGQMRSAARLPVFQNQLYGSRLLSPDGRRLFFLAQDALVPTDTNGREDVYQWEAAGKGGCTEASPSYAEPNGGCVNLISSGKAALDARFLDADESGANVFFTTVASLLPQDYGLVDVYDARAGGGLPGPAAAAPECEGEACQSPPPAPPPPAPASATYSGPGDLSGAASSLSRCNAAARRARRLSARAGELRRAARKQARRGNAHRAGALRARAARHAKGARRQSGQAKRCRARARADRRSQR